MANIILAPRKWRNKAILIKIEPTYGQDAIPDGLVNWIEARNVSLTPMDSDKVARNIEMPYMGSVGDILVNHWGKLSFDVALAPSGTLGTAPKWAPLLMACGTAETVTAATSVEYNLVSTGFASVSCYINIDGTLHKLLGMRGEVKGKMSAKGTPMLSFSFDANYTAPVSGLMPTIDRTGWMIEEGVNSANTSSVTIGAVPLAYSQFDWAFGNKVSRIDLPGPQREIVITDRAPTSSITVLAPNLATFNPFTLAEAGTTVALSTTHGSAAGRKVKTDMQVRVVGVEYDRIEELMAYKLTLAPVPVDGNDEIALTCI